METKLFLVTPQMLGYKDYTDLYLDWVNNFISVGGFADHHNIDIEKADSRGPRTFIR